MSEQEPPPWFEQQTKDWPDDPEFKARKAKLEEQLKRRANHDERRGRANSFMPYLLVRSVLGDRGDRPINIPFWESPDIWTAPGDPADTPVIPADHGGTAIAGQPNTLYAHVWNLGYAPLAGIAVEFYWFDPSVAITGSNANLIGIARCELASRGMNGSHLLVKCPKAWVPVMVNGGHECLVVRVSGIGDPVGNNAWAPWLNRHVGQRNIAVVEQGVPLMHLVERLDLSRIGEARLELLQVGPKEADLARTIAAPALRLRALATHPLGEVDLRSGIRLPSYLAASPAMRAPVHPMAAEGAPDPPRVHVDGGVRILHDLALGPTRSGIEARRQTGEAAATPLLARLLDFGALNESAERHEPLAPGEGAALRLATYRGRQLIGGYTLLVKGPSR